mmetsp:Transcript_20225/g.49606  ORF Transcript_20225/g.49606 Transcript_20225/m.49606 type:complete len:261 (+) Transcript_20225:2032-2814(+)
MGIFFVFEAKLATDFVTTSCMSEAKLGEIRSFDSSCLNSSKQATFNISNCSWHSSSIAAAMSCFRFSRICFPVLEEVNMGDETSSSSSIARWVATSHKSPKLGTTLSLDIALTVEMALSSAFRAAGPRCLAAARSFDDMEDSIATGDVCQKSEATADAIVACSTAGSFVVSQRAIASLTFWTYSTFANTSSKSATFLVGDTRFERTPDAASSSLAFALTGSSATTKREEVDPKFSPKIRSIAGPRVSKSPSPRSRSSSLA